jgi:anti-anti-sigma regulatory factor
VSEASDLKAAGGRADGEPLVVRAAAERAWVVCLSGTLDAMECAALQDHLREGLDQAARAGRRLVLDLTEVRLLSAAAAGTLDAGTAHLAATPVFVVTSGFEVRTALRLATGPGLRLFPTLAQALAELADEEEPLVVTRKERVPRAAESPSDAEDLRSEVFGLRTKARTSALIGVAQGVLVARYGLPAPGSAFQLLRESSQRFNVPLRVLASALITAPSPQDASTWFPGRAHPHSPGGRFLRATGADPRDRRQVLKAAMYEAVVLSDADTGELHLADPAQNHALVLEEHHRLSPEYRDWSALVSGPPAICARAQAGGTTISVADSATEPGLSGRRAGETLLAAGVRAVHSVPMVDASGDCKGVLSVHRAEPGAWLTGGQRSALEELASEVAAWRSWYRRTVVLDALDFLHDLARHPSEGPA